MCLPMTPAGPDSVVMNPIFTGSAAPTCPATRAATNARTRAPLRFRTGDLLVIWRAILARYRGIQAMASISTSARLVVDEPAAAQRVAHAAERADVALG